jgi:hypothetical protein
MNNKQAKAEWNKGLVAWVNAIVGKMSETELRLVARRTFPAYATFELADLYRVLLDEKNTKRVFTALRDNGETLDTYGIREIPVVLQRTVMLREYMRDNGERVIVLEEEVCSIGELDDVSDET